MSKGLRIGFIGDIIGKPGRTIIKECLKEIREQENLDCVIANAENVSHGFGMAKSALDELFEAGVDVVTGGNHTWDKKETLGLLDMDLRILRPHNYPQSAPGLGARLYEFSGQKLGILNLMGHFGMPHVDNAFLCAQEAVKQLKEQGAVHLVIDFHAEATSEKKGMFWLMHSFVSAVLGTHTHIGTDDLEVASGTLGVSDVGACGCMDGIVGMDKKAPLQRFLSGIPVHFEIPDKCRRILPMVIFETNDKGHCVEAYKIRVIDKLPYTRLLDAFFY